MHSYFAKLLTKVLSSVKSVIYSNMLLSVIDIINVFLGIKIKQNIADL